MQVDSNSFEALHGDVVAVVLEHVRGAITESMRCDLHLDSSLHELGLDSLASMEVVNRIEEAFGIRFSEDSLFDIATCRNLVDCVIQKVDERDMDASAPARATVSLPPLAPIPVSEITAEHYDVTQFPECLAFQQRLAETAAAGFAQPVLSRQAGGACGDRHNQRPPGDQLHELRLPGPRRTSEGRGGRAGRDRPLWHQCLGQPVGRRQQHAAGRSGPARSPRWSAQKRRSCFPAATAPMLRCWAICSAPTI